MPIQITITVKTDNHGTETVVSKTYSGGEGNPAYDGSVVRKKGHGIVDKIADQLDRLVDQPLSD